MSRDPTTVPHDLSNHAGPLLLEEILVAAVLHPDVKTSLMFGIQLGSGFAAAGLFLGLDASLGFGLACCSLPFPCLECRDVPGVFVEGGALAFGHLLFCLFPRKPLKSWPLPPSQFRF